jgi:hypothetical protein
MIIYLLIFILLLSFLIYYFYLKPKHQIQQFATQAINAGYKVKLFPYNPFKFFVLDYMKQDNRSLKVYKE